MKKAVVHLVLYSFCLHLVLKAGLMLYWHVDQQRVVAQYCENIARPELECAASCFLKTQLADESVDSSKPDTQSGQPQSDGKNLKPNHCDWDLYEHLFLSKRLFDAQTDAGSFFWTGKLQKRPTNPGTPPPDFLV